MWNWIVVHFWQSKKLDKSHQTSQLSNEFDNWFWHLSLSTPPTLINNSFVSSPILFYFNPTQMKWIFFYIKRKKYSHYFCFSRIQLFNFCPPIFLDLIFVQNRITASMCCIIVALLHFIFYWGININ